MMTFVAMLLTLTLAHRKTKPANQLYDLDTWLPQCWDTPQADPSRSLRSSVQMGP